MEDPFLYQWHLNSVDEPSLLPIAAAFGESLQHHSFSYQKNFNPKISMETALASTEIPAKHLKNNIWSVNRNDQTSEAQFASCQDILSIMDSSYINQLELVKAKDEMVCPKINSTTPRDMISQGTLGNQNYVFKASQEDKQTDKASVLGDAIKYLKQLQEKVKALEEEQNMKKTVESVVVVKKYQLSNNAEDYSSESGDPFDEELPEIEARFCDRNVLIKIHCEKNKGVIEKTINEIEKLHLKVTNSSAMTFGNCALDITVIAQMEKEFCLTVKDLVRNLRSPFASII